MDEHADDQPLRARALNRLRKKREFGAHLFTYLVVNAFIIVIWAAIAGGGFFWPIFPLLGWGIGLVLHAWDVYRAEPTEADIRKEMERLK